MANKTYIEQLTWLRGIAAFFVIISHTIRATEVQYSSTDQASHLFIVSLFDLGSFGVVLFFALSGCTLYISNVDKLAQKGITHFYIKRFFRIWPAFVISLIFYILFGLIFSYYYPNAQGHWVENQFLQAYSIYDILSYLSFTFNITGSQGLFNNAYWSLPVEFQYYLIFPFIIYSIKRIGIIGPIIIGAILFLIPRLNIIHFAHNLFFTLAFSFCGGVLIGYIYKHHHLKIAPSSGLFMLILLTIYVSCISNSYIQLPDIPLLSNIWVSYGVSAILAVLIVLYTKVDVHSRFEQFLKHYGTISYSTYLYHNIFVACSVLLIIHFSITEPLLRVIVTLSATLIATYISASLSYQYIEKPFINIGRKLLQAPK